MRGSSTLKRVDRWIGIPLLFVLGPLARFIRRLSPRRAPNRIGVIKEAAIGDAIVMAGALSDLRRAYPHSTIVFFAGPSNIALARMLAIPDQVVLLPLERPLDCIKVLRAHHLDLLFDAGQWPRINALLCLMSGASWTVGFKTPRQHRHLGYDEVVAHRADIHEVDNFRRLLSIDRVPPSQPSFDIRYTKHAPPTPEPYAVLHQWPGGERSGLKEWPQENWVAVARHLQSRGLTIVLTGAPSDKIRNENVAALLAASAINHAGRPLSELPSMLEQAEVVVSVNTGLMHMAAVMDVPVVGLHGPTSVRRWGPWGTHAIAVASRDPASQYLNLGFEYPAHCSAMRRLEPADVIESVDLLLARSPRALAAARA